MHCVDVVTGPSGKAALRLEGLHSILAREQYKLKHEERYLRCPGGEPPCGRTEPCQGSSISILDRCHSRFEYADTYVENIGLDTGNSRGKQKGTNGSGTAEQTEAERASKSVSM